MRLFEYVRLSIDVLFVNKIRSLLTMLGIIIGVSNIIVVVCILQAGSRNILKEFDELGGGIIEVYAERQRGKGAYLDPTDLKAMRNIPGIKTISPEASWMINIKVNKETKKIMVIGTTFNLKEIENLKVEKGRFISFVDDSQSRKLCVISSKMSEEVFKYAHPIGKKIVIENIIFRVIGVIKEKTFLGGGKDSLMIYIPFSTAQRILGVKEISSIKILAHSTTQIEDLIERIKEFLSKKHKDAFEIMNWKEVVESTKEVSGIITLIVGCVAAISLLVGGIGIMNIMLVQVRERTREIGIRKAIGASRKDILTQFLIESSILSLGGGIIGIIIGILTSNIVTLLIMHSSFVIDWGSVILGCGVSIGVGLSFGLYPANIAAKLEPIEALRYE